MTFPERGWEKYINMLSAINNTAAKKFTAYLNTHETDSRLGRQAAIDYAYAIATQYGESAAAASCEMYDAVAEASGVALPPAVPADTAPYSDVAKAVNGLKKQNADNEMIGDSIGRLVKRAGADTTLKNAIRDGAECAWIPHGDTCAFCIMLASNGWQRASRKTLKGDHAEHIHANCNCEFAIRFDGKSNVAGYDPDKYKEMWDNTDGRTWQEKLQNMRHDRYQDYYKENKADILAHKREKYAELHPKSVKPDIPEFVPAKNLQEAEEYAKMFANNVSLKGIALDNINEINEQLTILNAKYPTRKLTDMKQNGRMKAVARACFDSLEIHGKKIGIAKDGTFEENQTIYKNMIHAIKSRYQNGKLPPDMQKKVERYEKLLRYKRWGVTNDYGVRGTVTHEYGHIIADQYWGMINGGYAKKGFISTEQPQKVKLIQVYEKAKKTGDIFNISQYAATDEHEFFAEAFTAREFGEKLPDYINDIVEEILNGTAL